MHLPQHIAVAEAVTDDQIIATRSVMLQLRPLIPPDAYLPMVRRMMASDGYHLAALYDGETVAAVAGYRYMEMLYCGKILYVNDLNTNERRRSRGYGKAVMDWLKAEAKAHDCVQLHLDSGVQREDTHRFYFRERLTINCHHFHVAI